MSTPRNTTPAARGLEALTALTEMGDRLVPTEAERRALAGWPGWGPLAPALELDPEGHWADVAGHLESFFGKDLRAELEAREAVDNAFYTPDWLVSAMWDLLVRAGFTGGRVLEPGCGSGRFMTAAPSELDIDFTGIEKDPTSARIAQALNPRATILAQSLQEVSLGAGRFDAVIGNVPFASGYIHDGTESRWFHRSLHHYFFGRALELVRPGGYLVLITSRHLMDSDMLTATRHDQDTRCDLVGAVRLPAGTFRTEGTDVVADLIVLRRTAGNTQRPWHNTNPFRTAEGNSVWAGGENLKVSSYWESHPEHIAGTMSAGTHHARALEVKAHTTARQDVTAAIDMLAEDLLPMLADRSLADGGTLDDVVTHDAEGRPEGSFYLAEDGTVVRIVAGAAEPVARPSKELKALIGLREQVTALMDGEANLTATDAELAPLRSAAHQAWTDYVKAFGALNRGTMHEGKPDPETGQPALSWRRPPMGGFRGDPASPIVMAIEVYDPETGQVAAAPILLRRVNRAPEPITTATDAGEALGISLGETGRVDLQRIAGLLGHSGSEGILAATEALGDLVYPDPERNDELAPAATYLSGNVRARLDAARTAAMSDPSYQRNVAALEAVLPADLGPTEIQPALGAPWIDADVVQQFIKEELQSSASVERCDVTGTWSVDTSYSNPGTAATTLYGTSRMDGVQIIACLISGKAPVVYDEIWEAGRMVKRRNDEQTVTAATKAAAIAERFATWLWEDAPRANRLCAEYNRRFNSYVAPAVDGSHLKFPGMASDRPLWAWQQNMVQRIATTGATLCAHAVGSGKTLTMIASVMTLRRLGLATKPMLVVPNHLLEQISREARQAYPMGRFLIAGKEDLAGEGRRLFAARCATGDWDAVVITHSGFTSLPVDQSTEEQFVLEQKSALNDGLRAGGRQYGHSAKAIARRLRSVDNQLEKLRDRVGDPHTVTFEQLGVDFLAVDEAHLFKRLSVGPSSFSMGSSKRATDLLLKIRLLEDRAAGRPHVSLFTGTPWTNTLAETFVWQTYLQPEILAQAGLTNLDTWMAQFVTTESKIEVAPDGSGFRVQTRPTALRNVPELRSMLGLNADVLPSSALPLERPERKDHTVVSVRSHEQADYVDSLVERAERLRTGSGLNNDNMLAICGEGRRVALDPRLVGVDGDSPKVLDAAKKVAEIHLAGRDRIYGESAVPGVFQIVFCDQGTPNADSTQTYGRLRQELIARGVPAAGIRWIHEANTDKAKEALFTACRDGSVSVLIGSTDKMGYGTNVQTRLAALHHVDAPWRPSDLEQRDGRALRPKNLNAEVDIYRYVTENTFDAFMWQTLERKAYFIAQMMQTDSTARQIEDLGDAILDFGQIKALATGNPELLELFSWKEKARRLRMLRSVDRQSLTAAVRDAERADEEAKRLARQSKALQEALDGAGDCAPDESALRRLAALARDQARAKPGQGAGATYHGVLRAGYGPIEVALRPPNRNRSASRSEWTVEISHRYRTLEDLKLKTAVLRAADQEQAEDDVAALVGEWWAEAPARVDQLEARCTNLKTRAVQARSAADGWAFTQAGELAEAEAKIASIEAAIASTVEVQEVVQAA